MLEKKLRNINKMLPIDRHIYEAELELKCVKN